MENDARVALVGRDNATSILLIIDAGVYSTLAINGVHRVSLSAFSPKLYLFHIKPVVFVSKSFTL